MSESATPTWHMRRALRLAEKGRGFVLPNPMVGAVIVKDGKRIGEGHHARYGGAHAEVEALKACEESPQGATLFVTLEPCDHHGKTPPCTEAILEAGIQKVVIAAPDPLRSGVEKLKAAGLEVEMGLLEAEARELNRAFYTFHEKKRPFVTLKWASSLDGMIAAERGKRTDLTSIQARRLTHVLRHEHHAILIGAGTLIADDPHLGVREIEGRNPLRIVLKGERDLPQAAQFFRDEEHLVLENLSLPEVLTQLHEAGVVSVLVEGGAQVLTQFLDAGLYDEIKLFMAPTLLGQNALPFYEGTQAHGLKIKSVRECGPDLLVTATPA